MRVMGLGRMTLVSRLSVTTGDSSDLGILKGDASNMLLVGGADRRKGGSLMNGKVLDVALVAVVAIAFLASVIFFPGVGTLMIALVGVLALGYYNSYVRHDPAEDKPPVDPHDSLRAAWRRPPRQADSPRNGNAPTSQKPLGSVIGSIPATQARVRGATGPTGRGAPSL
jgi:hypothetical protein